ncbi:MAG: T9SS type A sorting domain-containing protein [Bacteroidota bacterium]
MVRIFTTIMLALLLAVTATAKQIVLEGTYQGKNLYVRNQFAGSGVGFCVFEVLVNGNVTTDEYNSSAFEIDFEALGLKTGDKVVVVIRHKDDCKPKVLNPEVLTPKSTFKTKKIWTDDQGVLHWVTSGESGVLTYKIEQYRWNKWVYVGEVDGKGISQSDHEYSFQVTPHSGENKFRVAQVDYTGVPKRSPEATYNPGLTEVSIVSKLPFKDQLIFSDATMYEIFDIYGNVVKRGYAKELDTSNLKKGVYYINYDNKTEEAKKK